MAAVDLSVLQTEGCNPKTMNIDNMSTLHMCRVINEEDATVAQAVHKCLPDIAATIDTIAPRIRKGGRLIYVGAGTSGRLGILDASEIPPTFSAPSTQFIGIIAGGDAAIRTAQEGAEDSHSLAVSDLESLSLDPKLDTVLGIAASGRTPYVLACLKFAKERGCLTVGVACVSGSEVRKNGDADHVIEVLTGPEVVTGSTRLKAGTGTKMVLNMLSTGVMVKVGKTYGNMMVDLKATNVKLKQRSRNIIKMLEPTASEISDEDLDARIQECSGSVKLALMTFMTGCEKQHCEETLEQAGGVLSTALKTLNAPALNSISDETAKPENRALKRKLVVCIDGGGSKCAVALSDKAGNIGRGEAGPCNVTEIGIKRMAKVVTLATQRALQQLYPTKPGMEWGQDRSSWKEKIAFTKVRAGMAGFDRPEMPAAVEAALSIMFDIPIGPNLRVTNDVDLLASAIEKRPGIKAGIVLVAGTGSVAMSYRIECAVAVRTGREGGWGAVLGDAGSGFDIGRMAVQHTLSELESAKIGTNNRKGALKEILSPFCILILKKLQVPEGSDVSFDFLSHVLTAESPEKLDLKLRIASLAPAVLEASSCNQEAYSIVHRAVDSIISTMLRLVRPESVIPSESVLVLAGGLMKSAVYRKFLTEKLGELNVLFQSIDIIEDGALAGLMSLS